MRKHLLISLLAITGFTAAHAEEAAGSRQTREFVQATAASDTFEIMEAQTALAESQDSQVRAFATRMLQEHARTSNALIAAAKAANMEPPKLALDQGQSQMLAALQSARGKAFDMLYWRQQALAHRAALVTQQNYARDGDQPGLRQLATANAPVIQSHLGMAEQMRASAGAD